MPKKKSEGVRRGHRTMGVFVADSLAGLMVALGDGVVRKGHLVLWNGDFAAEYEAAVSQRNEELSVVQPETRSPPPSPQVVAETPPPPPPAPQEKKWTLFKKKREEKHRYQALRIKGLKCQSCGAPAVFGDTLQNVVVCEKCAQQ